MSFIADLQTLEDLNLTGKYRQHSIYSLFDNVRTAGGERLLEEMFRQPLTDVVAINYRSSLFRYFQGKQFVFPLEMETFNVAAGYFSSIGAGSLISAAGGVLRKKLLRSLLRDEQYDTIHAGLIAAIEVLNTMKELVDELDAPFINPVEDILNDPRLAWIGTERGVKSLPVLKVARYDVLLRHTFREEMMTVLDAIYQLDVCIAVSDVARERHFTYARALPAHHHVFRATGLRHPGLEKAVGNPLTIDSKRNVVFLTGANMAGKSTFMKSFGIAVYLAHIGFPVAADELDFSVRDGIYSSINVPDSLTMGYSHFYAEVLRVKKVAEAVSAGKNLVVIFDELFKGTNVKDAYDATLACTSAFAKYHNSFFIISTHIIEVGEALRGLSNLQFAYLPTVMEGRTPRYTYQLTEGVTSDRQGMIIIEQEKILEILNE